MTNHEFGQFIAQIRYGDLHEELTEKLREIVLACGETGKVGEITLTLKLKPGKSGQIEIDDTVKAKVPVADQGTTLMFSTPDGFLQREDPRQMSIDGLKSVETGRGELRTLGS